MGNDRAERAEDMPGTGRDSNPAQRSSVPSPGVLTVALPADFVERVAERAAALVLAQLHDRSRATSPFFSVREAVEYMRAKPQRVHDLLSARRLTRYKDGRRTLVSRQEVDDYLARGGRSRVAPTLPHPSQDCMNNGLVG